MGFGQSLGKNGVRSAFDPYLGFGAFEVNQVA